MNSEERDPKLLASVAALLDKLGPFTSKTRREDKWRTTDQIANELGLFCANEIDHLNQVLREHEARCLKRSENGPPPEAVIRRAKYPDRTTALPLWGSITRHGWIGNRPDRSDPPDDIPCSLRVPDTSPHVFLSHTHQDVDLALRLAEAFAAMQIGSWRFETHILQREDIADCVRKAIAETACLVALATRYSIASLWVLTELETALKARVPVVLVVDTDDALLLKLLESVRFPHLPPNGNVDNSVEYCRGVISPLNRDYALRETKSSRAGRYANQVHDFLSTLPGYLSSILPGTTQRVWRPALAFPQLPARWSGAVIKLGDLQELHGRIKEKESNVC
jgi:hypothetical protein